MISIGKLTSTLLLILTRLTEPCIVFGEHFTDPGTGKTINDVNTPDLSHISVLQLFIFEAVS